MNFIACNAGVFCCAINFDFQLMRDRVGVSQKNDLRERLLPAPLPCTFGSCFKKKKTSALQAMNFNEGLCVVIKF